MQVFVFYKIKIVAPLYLCKPYGDSGKVHRTISQDDYVEGIAANQWGVAWNKLFCKERKKKTYIYICFYCIIFFAVYYKPCRRHKKIWKVLWSGEGRTLFCGNLTLHIALKTSFPQWNMKVVAVTCHRDVLLHPKDGYPLEFIPEENLLEDAKDLRLRHRFTFQQDNEPKHAAKVAV